MNAVLATLGTKLTERVVAKLTGPGLLYLALCVIAFHTGHGRALDASHAAAEVDAWLGSGEPLHLTVMLGFLFGAATLAGLLAALIGREVVGRLWVADSAPAWWIGRRQEAWRRRHRDRDPKPPTRYEPQRLTRIGDRFRLVAERVDAQYGLSVPQAWPRLMVLAGGDGRAYADEAYERYRAATALTAWMLLVLPWALWWWPALPIAVFGLVLGYLRSRSSAENLAVVIESVIDTHQTQLAAAVGVKLPAGRLTPAEGPHINNILNKRA